MADNNDLNSPTESFSSTTSNLIRKSKEYSTFENLNQGAERDKSRLNELMNKVNTEVGRTESTSSKSVQDDIDDCDEFIVNKSRIQDSTGPSRVNQPSDQNDFSLDNITDRITSLEIISPEYTEGQNAQLSSPEPSSNESSKSGLPVQTSSRGNRRSIVSDYTPSIHEVNQFNTVAYVVDSKSQSTTATDLEQENVSRKPSVIRITKKGPSETEGKREPSLYQQKDQAVSQEHFRIKSPSAQSLLLHQKNKSLASSNPSTFQTSSSKYQSSSNYSGSDSKYQTESYTTHESGLAELGSANFKLKEVTRLTRNDSLQSTDTFHFDDGDHLTTKHASSPEKQTADKNQGVELEQIPLPSRSPRRPVSGLNIKDQLISKDEIKDELLKFEGHKKSKSIESEIYPQSSINELIGEINDEITTQDAFPSANSEEEHSNLSKVEKEERDTEIHNPSRNVSAPRPLPPPPVPQHVIIPSGSSRGIQDDDGFETESEPEVENRSEEFPSKEEQTGKEKRRSSKRKSTNSKRKHKSDVSSAFEKNQFNHDTLVQLLQITNGTIVGQEFQNLGLQTMEKQLLERLVDSLSRLTADMIVDEERHDESVKRLNKAIKALEGF